MKQLPLDQNVSVADSEPLTGVLNEAGKGYQVLSQVLRKVQGQRNQEGVLVNYRHHIDNWSDTWKNSMDDD